MRKVLLHQPTGHPYWNKSEYRIEFPKGNFIDVRKNFRYSSSGYEIFFEKGSIYVAECACGSGFGKVRIDNVIKLIDVTEYDQYEFVGDELSMSKELIDDLRQNRIEP